MWLSKYRVLEFQVAYLHTGSDVDKIRDVRDVLSSDWIDIPGPIYRRRDNF